MHEIEGTVDLIEGHSVRNEIIDVDLSVHVPVNNLGHIRSAFGTTESSTAPVASGDELEWPG